MALSNEASRVRKAVWKECRARFLELHGVPWRAAWTRKVTADYLRERERERKGNELLTQIRNLPAAARRILGPDPENDPTLTSSMPTYMPPMRLQAWLLSYEAAMREGRIPFVRPESGGRPRAFRGFLCIRFLQCLDEQLPLLPAPMVAPFVALQRYPRPTELAAITMFFVEATGSGFPSRGIVGALIRAEARRCGAAWKKAKADFDVWEKARS